MTWYTFSFPLVDLFSHNWLILLDLGVNRFNDSFTLPYLVESWSQVYNDTEDLTELCFRHRWSRFVGRVDSKEVLPILTVGDESKSH